MLPIDIKRVLLVSCCCYCIIIFGARIQCISPSGLQMAVICILLTSVTFIHAILCTVYCIPVTCLTSLLITI